MAATRLFAEKGYQGASMSELSRLTGAAGGTIFHHFKNKEDLFVNILKDIKETILEQFEQYRRSTHYKDGLAMVEGAVTFYLHMAGTLEDRFLLLHRHFAYRLAETNPVCRKYLESIYTCLLDIFEEGILLGQKDGSLCKLPARNTAMILFSMVDGIARFNTYSLYDGGALYPDLMISCRRLIAKKQEPAA